jgi:thiamine biosynthesis lipoprotein
MGTTYSVIYFDEENRNLQTQLDSLLVVVNNSLSTYIPTSTISRINESLVPAETDSMFRINFIKAQEVSKLSNGAFDCTVMPLVNAWGFGFKKMGENPDSNLIASLLPLVGYEKVKLENNLFVKDNPQTQVDFSALAKGYGVDVLSLYLESLGIKAYMVEIGGEVRTGENKPAKNEPWVIGIDKPTDVQVIGERNLEYLVKLTKKSMATSGNYRNFYVKDGKKYAHEINPKSGFPVEHNLLSATVMANDCMTADAWATAFMILGTEASIEYLESQKELSAILIFSNTKGEMETYFTPGVKEMLTD